MKIKNQLFASFLGMGLLLTACGGEKTADSKSGDQSGGEKPAKEEFNPDYVRKLAGYAIEGYTWDEGKVEIKEKNCSIQGVWEPTERGAGLPDIRVYIYDASGGKYDKKMQSLEEFAKDQMTSDDNNFKDTIVTLGGYQAFERVETPKEMGKSGARATVKTLFYHDGLAFEFTIMAFNMRGKTEAEGVAYVREVLDKAVAAMPKP